MLNVGNKPEKHLPKIILSGWMIFLMAGCNPIGNPSTSDETPRIESTQATNTQGVVTPMNPSETLSASGPGNLIEKVKADLAKRLAIPGTQVNLVEATEVEWADSSLGCPQPEMSYLQVITPGYLILLEVNGTQYEYHSNGDAYFVYCDSAIPPVLPKP